MEFEEDFIRYCHDFITPSVSYFSLLRPWSEVRIAEEFAKHKRYHEIFRSCNRGSKENIWCCDCSKCLFVFILMAKAAGIEATTAMFGQNMFTIATLNPILDELAGFAPNKPFECVGTVEETIWCMDGIIRNLEEGTDVTEDFSYEWPLLMHYRKHRKTNEVHPFKEIEPELARLIPEPFRGLVIQEVSSHSPENIREEIRKQLEPHTLAVLGFGMEGQSTYRFLRSLFPDKVLAIADAKSIFNESDEKSPFYEDFKEGLVRDYTGNDYVQRLAEGEWSLVFKSPGIPLKQIDTWVEKQRITSQAELFTRLLRERIIGITGTKGKSTTAQLVMLALKASGLDAITVGNMGKPVLDTLLEDNGQRLYVFEMSSHMLETMTVSPGMAVLLNVYEEHLDHYRSYDGYVQAKLNILRFQKPGDKAVLTEQASSFAEGMGEAERFLVHEDSGSYPLPFGHGNVDSLSERKLAGKHNFVNIVASLAVTALCGVKDLTEAKSAVTEFQGLEHRMEFVGVYRGIRFYNDSISTIPQASICAAESIRDLETLIIGGLDRGIDYRPLFDYLIKATVSNIIGLPQTGHKMVLDLQKAVLVNPKGLYMANDMSEAVEIAYRVTASGKACVLSPAAASYGFYKDFQERGTIFKNMVRIFENLS
jgi:UDP-N-acetylmuramoylalanine--D-glutamate ligase